VNRQPNKEFSQECLPACTWKKILLIALESPELCSTLAAIKELISRRHKELITIKTLKRVEEQRSREFLCGYNGGIFRGVLCFRNHTQNDLEFSLKLKLWDLCN
jgi:hypothetical protein